LFNLKRKVKNKAYIKVSIYEIYIVEEISIFILYYFKPHLKTKINRVPRHKDSGEVSSSENLSIFSHHEKLKYILFNCDELKPFIQ